MPPLKTYLKIDRADHFVAGSGAGLLATAMLHPLDLIKTRFQVHEGSVGRNAKYTGQHMYKSTFAAFRHILSEEGFRGVYRGLSPALLGSGVSWGLYFFIYENAKARYNSFLGTESTRLPPQYHMISGIEAGVTIVLLTNPIWLIKTRLQLQGSTANSGVPATQHYNGFFDAAKRVVKEEGFFALYRGIIPGLLLVSHGALQFMFYEEFKYFFKSRESQATDGQVQDVQLSSRQHFIMGAMSKALASTITYPPQVIKSRIQQRQVGEIRYTGTIQAAQTVLANEGIRGLYKGLGPTLLRVVPQSAITFTAYEKIKQLLNKEW